MLTGPDASHQRGCQSTSNQSEDQNCEAGLSGQFADEATKIWKSDREGKGAALTIQFTERIKPTEIVVKQVNEPMEMLKKT